MARLGRRSPAMLGAAGTLCWMVAMASDFLVVDTSTSAVVISEEPRRQGSQRVAISCQEVAGWPVCQQLRRLAELVQQSADTRANRAVGRDLAGVGKLHDVVIVGGREQLDSGAR